MNIDLLVQAIANGVLLAGFYALVTLGLNLLFGVLEITNFAHGDLIMMGAYATLWLNRLAGVDPIASIPIVFLVLFGVGLAVYLLFFKPILKAPAHNQIALTFGLSVFLQSLALIAWGSDLRTLDIPYVSKTISLGPVTLGYGRLIAFSIAAAFTLGFFAFLKWSKLGYAVRAVSQDPEAASLLGVNVNRIYALVSGLAAALGGVAGVLVAINLYIYPYVGVELTLKAFSVVILGGMGSYVGMLVASLVLGISESLVGAFFPQGSGLAPGVAFAIIVLVLAVKPEGLFRR